MSQHNRNRYLSGGQVLYFIPLILSTQHKISVFCVFEKMSLFAWDIWKLANRVCFPFSLDTIRPTKTKMQLRQQYNITERRKKKKRLIRTTVLSHVPSVLFEFHNFYSKMMIPFFHAVNFSTIRRQWKLGRKKILRNFYCFLIRVRVCIMNRIQNFNLLLHVCHFKTWSILDLLWESFEFLWLPNACDSTPIDLKFSLLFVCHSFETHLPLYIMHLFVLFHLTYSLNEKKTKTHDREVIANAIYSNGVRRGAQIIIMPKYSTTTTNNLRKSSYIRHKQKIVFWIIQEQELQA